MNKSAFLFSSPSKQVDSMNGNLYYFILLLTQMEKWRFIMFLLERMDNIGRCLHWVCAKETTERHWSVYYSQRLIVLKGVYAIHFLDFKFLMMINQP